MHAPELHPVVFVGAGPGPVDLLTLRGAQRLAAAEVVLFDALTDVEGFRRLAPGASWIDVGKRGFSGQPGCDASGQARINHLLVRHALAGARVLRLKGGDPSLFGRLEEELEALAAAGLQAEVVPGVTAALAAAADLQRPLTRRGRGRSVRFSTAVSAVPAADTPAGQPPQGRLELPAGPRADTEVFYMAGKQLAALGRRLLAAGWAADTAVAVVSRAGCTDRLDSSHRLNDLAAAAVLHAGRPTVVCVGLGAEALMRPRDADCAILATRKARAARSPVAEA
ncbi:uroporphyrinogen-III C-methyltransferase [Aquariibacter lacus]|uniref:uroporphyrinogen-III C-methyltransferase n=1 Tax=Aquariibacter lacus TaxID=2801332 RepID=UPI0025741505|nr:uroporphyrinogen-III C-methyltransferase [Piscinibacter lacus]